MDKGKRTEVCLVCIKVKLAQNLATEMKLYPLASFLGDGRVVGSGWAFHEEQAGPWCTVIQLATAAHIAQPPAPMALGVCLSSPAPSLLASGVSSRYKNFPPPPSRAFLTGPSLEAVRHDVL